MSTLIDMLQRDLGIDADALRTRYRSERDKRLRPDGVAQFIDTVGKYAHYRDDPWADPTLERAALSDEVDVLVIGGGLGAVMLGAELRKAGVADIRFVERAGDFGGVWYWNRYPGAACDTQAILYLPVLEELGVMPPRRFATQPEILDHLQRIARHFDLYRDTCFQTVVTDVTWDEAAERWIIATDRGDAVRARFVVIPSGPMERPKLPGISGIADFTGHSFHTSRWDYAYTGGDAEGGLTGLADKVIGIIGTGASAVQCIPHLAAGAKHLYVFQRTPSSIDERDNREHDPAWIAGLQPGWQQALLDNFTAQVSGILTPEDLIRDGWTSVMTNIRDLLARSEEWGETVEHPLTLMPTADYMKMEAIRARVDAVVTDARTAAALKPWYDRFCKRPCFSNEYLPTFNRPNVTLVDTSGRGVERITRHAIVVEGREYPIDCLIYSTGFEVGAPFARRIGFSVRGHRGRTLLDTWKDGAATQHGVAAHGFPNLFIMSTIQTGLSLNFSHMIGEQARHIAYIVGRAVREDIRVAEVTRAAEAAWVAEIDRAAISQEAFQRECTPSYFNAEGDLARANRRNSTYGGGPFTFYRLLADWRDEGSMAGFDLRYASER